MENKTAALPFVGDERNVTPQGKAVYMEEHKSTQPFLREGETAQKCSFLLLKIKFNMTINKSYEKVTLLQCSLVIVENIDILAK